MEQTKYTDEYLRDGNSLKRLINEYILYDKSLVIAFDFDNTVYDFHKKGETYDNVVNLLRDLKEIGCYLICFTANNDLVHVKNYLDNNNIPYHAINENPPFYKKEARKIFYNAFLDDRAGLLQVFEELSQIVQMFKKN